MEHCTESSFSGTAGTSFLLRAMSEYYLKCARNSAQFQAHFFFWTIHLKSNYFFLTSAVALISDYCFYLQPLLTGYYKKKQSFPVLFQFFHIDGRCPGGFYSKFLGVFILKFETFKFKLFWRVHCKTLSKYKSRKKVRCHKRKRKEMDDLLPLIQHVCFQTLSGIPHPSKDASGSGCFPFVSLARPKRSLSGIKRDSTKHRFTLCLTVINCKYITLHSEIAIRKTQYLCGGTLHSLLLWPAKNTWID